jgi:hypothetical protein
MPLDLNRIRRGIGRTYRMNDLGGRLEPTPADTPLQLLARLNIAINRHDLPAFIACFDAEYESDQPIHPDRRFRGRAQVERNWTAMFTGLPDFRAELLRSAFDGESVWVEWHWTGTRADGTCLNARGACIFGVRAGLLTWGRLYMEEVDAGRGIEAAVASLAGSTPEDRASEASR